jgi:flagellar biosynthesis protein FliQ
LRIREEAVFILLAIFCSGFIVGLIVGGVIGVLATAAALLDQEDFEA